MVGPDYQRPPAADPPTPEYKETTGPVIGAAANFQPAHAARRHRPRAVVDDVRRSDARPAVGADRHLQPDADAGRSDLPPGARARAPGRIAASYPTVTGSAGCTQSGSGSGSGPQHIQGAVVNASQGSVGQFSRWARAQLGDRPVGPHPAPDRKRFGGRPGECRGPRQCSGCRRRPTWRSTISRCASPSSASGSSGRWRPIRRSVEIVQNQLDAGIVSRVDLAQSADPAPSRRAPSWSPRTSPAPSSSTPSRSLTGKAPAEVSLEPRPLPPNGADARCPACRRRCSKRRPDIASAERQMAAANAQIGVAHGGLLSQHLARQHRHPGRQQPERAGLSSATRCGRSARQLAATLIDGGALKAQVEGARAGYDSQVALYRQTILVAFQQVEDALVQRRVLSSRNRCSAPPSPPPARPSGCLLNQYRARHRALHDGGADPDRGAVVASRACSASASAA